MSETVHPNTFYSQDGILDCVRSKIAKQLLKYDHEAEGVIVAFSHVQVLGDSFAIDYSPPSITANIKYRLLVFSPKPGCLLKAKVAYIAQEAHVISAHVFGLFNARISIPTQHLRNKLYLEKFSKVQEGDEIEFLVRKVITFGERFSGSSTTTAIQLEGHIEENFKVTLRAGQ